MKTIIIIVLAFLLLVAIIFIGVLIVIKNFYKEQALKKHLKSYENPRTKI